MADNRHTTQKLRIPGTPLRDHALAEAPWQVITLRESHSFQIAAARAGASDAPILDTDETDVVEVELEDGSRLWTSRDRFCDELFSQTEKRGTGDILEIPATLPLHGPSRGFIGAALIKTLRFIKIDVPKLAAKKLAKLWEDRTFTSDDGPGLYRCATAAQFGLTPVRPADLSADQPILLFLHGTASSTQGSFGELWAKERRAIRGQLFAPYQERIFALEHRTLTESPIQNAIALAEQLPAAARIHLVSHSRGGLIGELLCRTRMENDGEPFDAVEVAFFRSQDPQQQRGSLERLNALLKAKRFRIERFVRVACPTRGTTLASERFDLYLSILFNLLQKIPALKIGPGGIAYDILTELIMAIAKERTDPGELPGIEAMIPASPLIALLNRPGRRVEGELRVIAGDIEGESLGSLLGSILTDPLYLGDHDLVVDTTSMFGGAERKNGAAFSFHQGAQVSHFRYFQNEDSTTRLVKALTRKEGQEDGFEAYPVYQTDSGVVPYRRDDGRPRPVVFLLPGVMGSHLQVNGNRVWLDLEELGQGGLSRLTVDAQGVKPEAPVDMAYGELVQFLSTTHEVVPHPYDWRLSLVQEAANLIQALERKLEEAERHNQPVSIIAHSMGGLLVRAMIADPKGKLAWQRLCKHPDARLIMLGTPNGGSYIVPLALTGRETVLKQLALLNLIHLNLAHHETALIDIVRHYPGLLEMLPESDEQYNFFTHEAWSRLHEVDRHWHAWTKPETAALEQARAVRKLISQSLPTPLDRVCYVAGCAPATPAGFYTEKDRQGHNHLRVRPSPHGDGRVLWQTGQLPGVKTWYMQAAHGDLAAHAPAFPALLDLLQNGETDKLSTAPPETRGAQELREFREEKTPLYPDLEELTRAAIGSRRKVSKRKTPHRTQVSVVQGNLAYASHAVMVGHYEGDTIISAEAHLDRVLNGRLRDRHRLGLYPGAYGTAEVFLNKNKAQSAGAVKGAIVIGLGPVGDLSPGELMRAVSYGARAYALAVAESPSPTDTAPEARRSAKISSLLIGTGAGGLPVQDAILSILRGIAHANQSLETVGYTERVRIDEIEFIELYEDRAIQAAHALADMKNDVDLAPRFAIARTPQVQSRRGGRRRAAFFEDAAWWRRLQIIEEKEPRRVKTKRLKFNLLTDRARTEEFLQPTQRTLVDQFIDKATQTTSTHAEIAVTLFEMLIPNRLKEYAPDQKDLVLLLDEETARYPWELMRERQANDGSEKKPLAIQAGMVRQLQSSEFRENTIRAQGQLALVIGDPPSQFVQLRGAEQEAKKVLRLLEERSYDVTSVIRQDDDKEIADRILNALYARDYRIVHLAGHGVYKYLLNAHSSNPSDSLLDQGEDITGMVIGHDKFLTPAEFQQMRVVPDLVFINCCHLGRTEDSGAPAPNNPPRLAANVATQFIRMGVRAVVAAGWAVDDAAAQLFAETFYHEMLAGTPFGRAAQRARKAIFDASPTVNTWGAYQCYGDPAFTLTPVRTSENGKAEEIRFTAPTEAIVALENIAEDATTASETEIASLKEQLKRIANSLPTAWLDNALLRAALGRAYGELDLFKEAVEQYLEALNSEKAYLSLRAVEQLCNLQTRWAVEHAAVNREEATKLIQQAKERLQSLIVTLGETTERLSLQGSIAKREAVIAPTVTKKRQALRDMSEHYKNAYELGLKKRKQIDPYPLLNWTTADILLWLIGSRTQQPPALQERLRQATTTAAERDQQDPNFWDVVSVVDSQLLKHLADQDLHDHIDEMVTQYSDAKKRDASPREFRSVLEHLDFLADILSSAREKSEQDMLGKSVRAIRQKLAV